MTEQTTQPTFSTVAANGELVPGGGTITKQVAKGFFAVKGDNLEKATEDIKKNVLDEKDGEYIGMWLLTEITYWNRDKEKIVILCGNNVVVVKYDFITCEMKYVDRIQLSKLREVVSGPFTLPDNSLAQQRCYNGIRLSWGSLDGQAWYERWNPLKNDIPFTTFTSHPLMKAEEIEKKNVFDIKSFDEELSKWANVTGCTIIKDQPIIIESYVGVASFVHNQSRLGFSRNRGGVSF